MTRPTVHLILTSIILTQLYSNTDGLREACDQTRPCANVDIEVCDGNACTCISGYSDIDGTCVQDGSVGGLCNATIACVDEHSICNDQNRCRCDTGFARINATCATDCGTPVAIDNAEVQVLEDLQLLQFQAVYSCINGYTLTGESTLVCGRSGAYEGNTPTCNIVTCPTPPTIQNGKVIDVLEPVTYNTTVTYQCDDGYRLEGEATRTCQADGDYSGTLPTCVYGCTNDCTPGSCTYYEPDNTYNCLCPTGFSGDACELEDKCITDPCVQSAINCLNRPNNSPPDRVCICPKGFKGDQCNEPDIPVVCTARNVTVYLDTTPISATSTCFIKDAGSTQSDTCYNPDEGIVYVADDPSTNLVSFKDDAEFCVEFIETNPSQPVFCTDITAFEADDVDLRPWINATFTLCFILNNPPAFNPPATLIYNLQTDTTLPINLPVADQDSHQSHTFIISSITPSEVATLNTVMTIDGSVLSITDPRSLFNSLAFPIEATIGITVQDSGIPQLSSSGELVVKFVNDSLSCSVGAEKLFLHTEPLPSTSVQLGEISCVQNGATTPYSYSLITVESPVVIDDQGLISFDPTKDPNTGTFPTTVRVTTITDNGQLTSNVAFILVTGDLRPTCTSGDNAATVTFSEKVQTGICSRVVYTCTDEEQLTRTCADNSTLFDVSCDVEAGGVTTLAVCVAKILDQQPGTVDISVDVTNTHGSVSVQVAAVIDNVNDPPKLVRTTEGVDIETATIDETSNENLVVLTLPVTDPDLNVVSAGEELSVTLTDPSGQAEVFTAVINNMQDAVSVILTNRSVLDQATRHQFSLKLKVTDKAGLIDQVTVNIDIRDVNEPPTCPEYEKTVPASVQDGAEHVVVRLACSDPDFSDAFSQLTYSIEGDNANVLSYFAVDNQGVVKLTKSLADFTADNTILTFKVKVIDGGNLFVEVTINVNVSNTFPPVCASYEFAKILTERASANTCFTIATSCEDPVKNDTLVYRLDAGNGTDLFSLNADQTTNTQMSICNPVPLQNHYGKWLLYGAVTSSYGERPIQVTMTVNDVNDPPVFVTNTSFSVVENTQKGTTVFTVKAEDPDPGVFGAITYKLIGEQGPFNIDANTGSISVNIFVDAEVRTSYLLQVVAMDGAPSSLSSTVTLTVEILNVNDNRPECTQDNIETSVDLLATVGTLVYTLQCIDNDVEGNELVYAILDSTMTVFRVNASGHILLNDMLSTAVTTHSFDVRVQDNALTNTHTDTFSIIVSVIVNVNTEVPPQCDQTSIVKVIDEIQAVGFCLAGEISCTDPVGGTVTFESQSGNATSLLEIRTHVIQQQLGLSACIKASIKNHFGVYQLTGVVSNGLATTSINWTFTVENVNEAPVFMPAVYNVSVDENVQSQSTPILILTVSDPDDGYTEPLFEMGSVSVELTNNADFNNAMNNSILFVPEVLSFYVKAVVMDATIRNLFTYTATAVDKSGLSSTASINIHINDINSAPTCASGPLSVGIDILTAVDAPLLTFDCSDGDIDPNNVHLDYTITSGDQDNYFNVTEDGVLTVAKKLPRTVLYNTGTASMVILVSDRGSPPLSTSITVNVLVDNDIAAECTTGVTPPDIWVINKCVSVTMDCMDPTTTSNDHLSYTVTGNYTTGFNQATISGAKITMCYKLSISGVYEVAIRVSNGLEDAVFRETIVVNYESATPVFNSTIYNKDLLETMTTPSVALSVTATSANLIGELEYNMLGSESTAGWNTYFSLDINTGVISIIAAIKPLANQEIILKVEAEDTGSKLKSSTQVELHIVDINEAPTCSITSRTAMNIPVDSDIGTVLLTFTCSDADVKQEYKDLVYDLSTNAKDYFEIIDAYSTPGSKSIVTKVPLNVTIATYSVTLTVQDSAQQPLEFVYPLDVTINLLPPPLDVDVRVLDHDKVEVKWQYQRADYYTVIDEYRVTFTPSSGTEVKGYVEAGTLFYNATQLVAETVYQVLVTAYTTYGSRDSATVEITTPPVPILNKFTFTIRAIGVGYDYDRRLRNTDTQLYFTTTKEVTTEISTVLTTPPLTGFMSVDIVGYRPANSVYVDAVVTVNEVTGSVQATMDKLNTTVQSGWIQSLSVDSSYFMASIGDGYVAIEEALEVSTDEVYNGTDISITCNITTIGYPAGTAFVYWWTFREIELRPTALSRYSIENTVRDLPEHKQSVLNIRPINEAHGGLYACHVKAEGSEQFARRDTTIRVISQPTVIMYPASITVPVRSSVNVTCQTVTSLAIFDDFVWYKNGAPFTQTANELVHVNNTKYTITVLSVAENTVFSCEGVNKAGTGPRVFSYINVIPDQSTDKLCPLNVDGRGTTWEEAYPESVVTFPCQTNFQGQIFRVCSEKGRWNKPVYDCARETLKTIKGKVDDIKDGSSSSNLTNTLKELVDATDDTDLYEGDINTAVDTLTTVREINDEIETTEEETIDFLKVASNLIDERNKESWESRIEWRQEGAIDIPQQVEGFLQRKFNQISGNDETLSVANIHVSLGKGQRDSYNFPDLSDTTLPEWIKERQTGIYIPKEALKDVSDLQFASSFYKSITPILVRKLKRNGVVENIETLLDINSDIVAFQVKDPLGKIDPPAQITFQHFDSNYSDPICCYWDFMEDAFVTDGCWLLSTSDELTVCACNHFTNFAILMSPGKTPEADLLALSIISAIGCAISIFCLLLTMLLYMLVWRWVKSERSVLLMNLCAALIVAYALFLGGVGRADNETLCTVISALLHFFYLAVFFLMLAYGIEIFISVVFVFLTGSKLKYLLPLAWGIPVVIVGVTLGITKGEGYGNDEFCWLSLEDGVLWAFVGPALLVLVVNYIVVIAVLRQMFWKSSAMMTKSEKEKAKIGLRSICVLLPILGLTWVFGVFSVNKDMVAFQYIFAICNSLQGLLIFLFHCVFNNQLKEGLKKRNSRKKSKASIENTFKNQHSTGTTAFISNESKSGVPVKGDPDAITTSNPFLEADRQMKQLVAKQKKSGANVYDSSAANNKIDKDMPAKTVDLDDVKISNILRESGTAGVSSILQTEIARPVEEPTQSETPPESNAARQSQVSSKPRYDYIDGAHLNDNPAGYEKYLQPTRQSSGYDVLEPTREDRSSKSSLRDSSHSGTGTGTDKSRKEQERQRELDKQREREREKEREKQRKADRERQEKMDKQRKQQENKDKERLDKERKDREKERERLDRSRQANMAPIRITYDRGEMGFNQGAQQQASSGRSSSRSDDDRQGASSYQNITSISTAIPEHYDPYQGQGKKKKKDSTSSSNPKKSGDSIPKKDKKKSSLKDRSRAYEYAYEPYETTYLGGQSRHASLENMGMQAYPYRPYSNLPGMGGYQTPSRPQQQQQTHWDQYAYQDNPYGRGYSYQ